MCKMWYEGVISVFEFSRGHPIERGHYKQSLYDAEKRIAELGEAH